MNKCIYFLYFPSVNAVKIGITNDLNSRIITLEKTWGNIDIRKSYFAEHKRSHRYEQALHLIFTKYNKGFKTGDGFSEFFDPIVISLVKDMDFLDLYLKPLSTYSKKSEIVGLFNLDNFNNKYLDLLFTIIHTTRIDETQIKISNLREISMFKKFNKEILIEVIEKLNRIGVILQDNTKYRFKPLFKEIKIERLF